MEGPNDIRLYACAGTGHEKFKVESALVVLVYDVKLAMLTRSARGYTFVLLAIAVCYPFAGKAQTSPTTDRATVSPLRKPIRVNVDLVVVPVVVRDARGRPVSDLQKENFKVRDNNKPQSIVQFSLEQSDQEQSVNENERSWVGKFIMPSRFTVLLFDDAHLNNELFPAVRTAVIRRFDEEVSPLERFAILTTSGKVALDFTDDRVKLVDALNCLQWNPFPNSQIRDCMNMTYEEANEILNRHDEWTKGELIGRLLSAACGRINNLHQAEAIVMATSERVLHAGDAATAQVFQALKDVIGMLSRAPGARNIVLISPGFLISDFQHSEDDVINLALRNHVTISSIDARALSTAYENIEDWNPLAEFADGTGGLLFRNNNDFGRSIREISESPECVYFLGFSPSDLKSNGAFHRLDVEVVGRTQLSAKWRRGYFAPKEPEKAKHSQYLDLGPLMFSREVIHDLPIEMSVQFVQGDKPVAKLMVTTLVNLHEILGQKANIQDEEVLQVVAVVFDRNGIYRGALHATVRLQPKENAGEVYKVAKFDFIVDAGNYLVRLVACNSRTGQTYANNSLLQIPYKSALQIP